MDPLYLLSPVHTIADSLHERSFVSNHDLLDAYATLCSRLRSCAHLLEPSHPQPPALESCSDSIIRALRRDVGLAHVDSPVSIHLNGDARQHARDTASVCHHALCTVATIFRFPALYLAFPEHHLSALFGDILAISLSDRLRVFDAAKAYSLSLWILASHRLPASILGSWQDNVFSALQRSLDGTIHPCTPVFDGLKAISHTVQHLPSSSLTSFSPLLHHVIRNLHCESPKLHLQASIVLGKFAYALIYQTGRSPAAWQTISHRITSILESYCNESHATSADTSFLRIARTAFSADPHTSPKYAPTWVLTVLASLIVLCGPTLYTKSAVLHSILQALALTITHKRSVIRALHPHVWKCFVWTFHQMLLSTEKVEPALISSAFHVIKQEVSGGIGVALTNVLLSDRVLAIRSDERGDRVFQALSVLKAMVETGCSHTQREGFMLLQALTTDPRGGHQISHNMHELPASVLFNGAIVDSEWSNLSLAIRSIPIAPVSMHWLEKIEIARHYKTLLEIWKHFAIQGDRRKLNSALVDIWLSVLLACSCQFEGGWHDSTATEVLTCAAVMVVEFLPSAALQDRKPDWGSWDVRDQLCSLTIIDQLWSAIRTAFVTSSLAESAAFILTSILKYAFHVLDCDVRTLWGRLCANLMITASPSFLCDVNGPISPQLVVHSQRELWGVVATSLSSGSSLTWKELIKFLAIPICTWVLSDPELDAWNALCRNAMMLSGDPALAIEHFVLHHLQAKEVENWESIIAVFDCLLAYTHEHNNPPTDKLLLMVNVCLTVSYTRARHSSNVLTHSLRLLGTIRRTIVSAPGEVMRILRALCHGLCLWIEDHNEVMSDDNFNSAAVTLYSDTLEVLTVLPSSIQSLQDTEDFLSSAFSRIPTPAIAPFAFEKFWRATYHGRTELYDHLPEKIKGCVACFVAAYGGDLADGLSLTTGSQSQSVADESQVCFLTDPRSQHSGEPGLQASVLSREARAGGSGMDGVPQVFAREDDTTFLLPSPDKDTFQPTVLRQLREYSSQTDVSSFDALERSTGMLLSPIPMPEPHLSGINDPITSYVPNLKRKFVDMDDAPRKRSRTSRDTLRILRNLESEPASREVTPINVPRMKSVPLKKRMVFDGVQVPTLRQVLGREKAHGTDRYENRLSIGRYVSVSQTTPVRGAWRKSRSPLATLPSSVGSDDDDLDWENCCIGSTSSEVGIDQSLLNALPSSPSRMTPTSAPRGTPKYHSRYLPTLGRSDGVFVPSDELSVLSRSSLRKTMSQGRGTSTSTAPARPSLRRSKTASTRLDALRDVYSSVADGASQIPMSELLQATRLVHQIGAVLTEQMGKKMNEPG